MHLVRAITRSMLTAVVLFTAAVAHGAAPDRLNVHSAPDHPLWISKHEAMTPEGQLREEAFTASQMRELRENAARNGESCRVSITRPIVGERATVWSSDIRELVSKTPTLVAGEVVGRTDGFYLGTPALLFEVKVTERYKNEGHAPNAKSLFLVTLGASIETAAGVVCSAPMPGSVVVERGDRILVFSTLEAVDDQRVLLTVNPVEHIVVERNAHTIVPKKRAAMFANSFHDVLQVVRDEVAAQAERRKKEMR